MITRKAKILFVGLMLAASITLGQEQKPLIFEESDVVVGPQRLETRFLYAAGVWSDADKSLTANSAEIHCYRRFGFCDDAEAVPGGSVTLTIYDILRWDRQELIAVDSSGICVVNTLRFDLVAKKVSVSSVQKTDSVAIKDPLCKKMETAPAFLGGGVDDKLKADQKSKSH